MKWLSDVPMTCQVCGEELKDQFVDGQTIWGPWAIQCVSCFNAMDVGYGIGKGQLYDLKTKELIKGGREK